MPFIISLIPCVTRYQIAIVRADTHYSSFTTSVAQELERGSEILQPAYILLAYEIVSSRPPQRSPKVSDRDARVSVGDLIQL